ncbi:energy transducer TonB [Burkholderia sp. L27(2015)]|uniref:energy transducer TonB n=1 Tax=Burkholderia sp. L27(2015) TaxID=1641858 RepID=UPI00131D2564|nr:energy transducer TonB [Burkholderia sp. L27(2015)]
MIATSSTHHASAAAQPNAQRKAIVIAALVVLAHVLVLFVALHTRAPEVLKLEPPRSISVQLIAAPTPPAPPPPQASPKPTPPVTPPPTPRPVVKPLPKPVKQSTRPTETPVAPPTPPSAPATPAVAAPPANPVPAMPQTLPADTAPKTVEHLSCAIPPPVYPALSRRNGDSGTVLVKIVIDTAGRIETANVARSSGFPRLDDAAVQAVLQSHCNAHVENGQGIRSAALVPFRFTLDQ